MPRPAIKPTEPDHHHDDYLKRRDAVVLAYKESIQEYDRLVTWASAGALGLSITFLEKFGQGADSRTAWLLGAGWISLGAAFATSLWSQYFSSRIHSWKLRELDCRQLATADRPKTWADDVDRCDRKAHSYGATTRWLTFISGLLLVGGIMLVATFAFLNAPFKSAATTSDIAGDPPRTTVAPVTEKKGLEYLPEPVRRPQSPPPSKKPQPQEKR